MSDFENNRLPDENDYHPQDEPTDDSPQEQGDNPSVYYRSGEEPSSENSVTYVRPVYEEPDELHHVSTAPGVDESSPDIRIQSATETPFRDMRVNDLPPPPPADPASAEQPEDAYIPASPPPRQFPWRDVATVVILLALLVVGYWMRSVGRNWDDKTMLHPDERFLTQVVGDIEGPLSFTDVDNPEFETSKSEVADYNALAAGDFSLTPIDEVNCTGEGEELVCSLSSSQIIALHQLRCQQDNPAPANQPWEAGKGDYFDAYCSDLNPNNVGHGLYVYGQFPLFTTRLLGDIYNQLDEEYPDIWTIYPHPRLVGRVMSSVFDTLSILLVFLIGSRLVGRWPGLLAAAFYAFAAFPIQQSHFWTTDVFTSFWVLLAIYFAVRVLDGADNLRERFSPLPWLVAAGAVWIWDSWNWDAGEPRYDEPNFFALLLYLAIMLGVGWAVTIAHDQRSRRWGASAILVGAGVINLFARVEIFDFPQLNEEGALVATAVLAILGFLVLEGLRAYFTYSGTFPWLAAAFGLWVYDSMAYYDTPTLVPLAIYLIFFGTVALIVSAARHTRQPALKIAILSIMGTMLVLWTIYIMTSGDIAVSDEGLLTAVVLGIVMGIASFFGLLDMAGFGIAFGAAVASRVNVLPLVGVIILAALLRGLITLDVRTAINERMGLIGRLMAGLLFAAVLAFAIFRVLQPHAFLGPEIYNILELNSGWQEDINAAQKLTSGNDDIPPNHQWTNRVPWLFPAQNITLYGLGPALGVAAWVGLFWGLFVIVTGRPRWTRMAILAAWIVVYFGWLGGRWVTTMRYFLPIYGALVIFAAWLLWEIGTRAYRAYQNMPTTTRRRVSLAGVSTLIVFVTGYTMLYGYGFTSIYRHQLTRVAASRYFQEKVPVHFGVWVDSGDNAQLVPPLVAPNADVAVLPDGETEIIALNPLLSADITHVTLNQLAEVEDDPENEQLRVEIQVRDGAGGQAEVLASGLLTVDLAQAESVGEQKYEINFDQNVPIEPGFGRIYSLAITAVEGGPFAFTRTPYTSHATVHYADRATATALESEPLNIPVPRDSRPVRTYNIPPGTPLWLFFHAPADGTIQQIEVPNLADPLQDTTPDSLTITLINDVTEETSSGTVSGDFNPADDGQRAYGVDLSLSLDEPFPVKEGQRYAMRVDANQYLTVTAPVITTDGPWDDDIPYNVCPLPPDEAFSEDTPSGLCDPSADNFSSWSYFNGLQMKMVWEDVPQKRQDMLEKLNQTDYITISSNRFYDSYSRIPARWPMSNEYYDALFSGELGFEVAEIFESYAEVGPIEWKDQVLPTDDLPGWLNEFEAEEAFHVYDHPVVFVFRKTPDYSPEKAAEILDINLRPLNEAVFSPEPVNVIPAWNASDASATPTALELTEEDKEIQQEGGTWSEIFNWDSLINQNEVASVAVWWLLMVLVGWITFPLLYTIFPALPDRGFGVGKLVGWLLVAWTAWFASSLHIRLWSQAGLIFLLVVLAIVGALLVARKRREFFAFIKRNRRHLLTVEALTLALFLFFLAIRYANPDMWHHPKGGEKPMDLAYFNAILRSTIFPPLDPWHAGGYINYYYWGFVLIGAPVKVLGVLPAIAYNLLIPTLFAMTGMGAFTTAYNAVAWIRQRHQEAPEDDEDEGSTWRERFGPVANPYVAGIAALALAVVLGNLDTVRVFSRNVHEQGQDQNTEEVREERLQDMVDSFIEENGQEPNPQQQALMAQAAEDFAEEQSRPWIEDFFKGMELVLEGEKPVLAPGRSAERWYWGPTRVIAERYKTDSEGNPVLDSQGRPIDIGYGAITEMPYFTFLYGDLHAHMIAMSMSLLIMLFLLAEILGAGRTRRSLVAAGIALFLGAMTVGLLKATNSWDWPTYMILAVAGLSFAAWVGRRREVSEKPHYPLYFRLRRLLDLRNGWMLFPFLLVVPFGMIARGAFYWWEVRSYETALNNGEIPPQCPEVGNNRDELTQHEIFQAGCLGKLEPVLQPESFLIWGFGALALAIVLYGALLVFAGHRYNRSTLVSWVGRIGLFVAFSFIAIWPFDRWFVSDGAQLIRWEKEKTPLWAYLDIHGLFLFIIFSFLLWRSVRWLQSQRVEALRGLGLPFIAVVLSLPVTLILTLALGVLGEYDVFIVTLPMLVWVSVLFLLPGQSSVERYVLALVGLALGVTMGVEVYAFTVDNGRQNSVFKFYMQAWLLFSVAGGIMFAWLANAARRWSVGLRSAWQTVMTVLVAAALLYPIMATQARLEDRLDPDAPLTLNGWEYMKTAPYLHPTQFIWFNFNGDYHMMRWLQENVEGTPYIVEAQLFEYTWNSRISINTGLPTVQGWQNHHRQQRNVTVNQRFNINNTVANRTNAVNQFYQTQDIAWAWEFLQFYDVEYIIVGTFERITYNDIVSQIDEETQQPILHKNQSPGIAKFDKMVQQGLLEVVFEYEVCIDQYIVDAANCPPERRSTDKIYRVIPGARDVDYTEAVLSDE
jgi:uncharacterized membrane protein